MTTISGLTNATSYEWQVKTVCGPNDESAYSASPFSLTSCQPPNLSIFPDKIFTNSVLLTWLDFGIPLNFNINYMKIVDSNWESISNIAGNSIISTFSINNLSSNTNYWVYIQNVCADGTLSNYSSVKQFKTLESTIQEPINSTITNIPSNTENFIIPAENFTVRIPSGANVANIRISSFPTKASKISINGIEYTESNFPISGIIIPTNALGQATQPIVVSPKSIYYANRQLSY